MKTIRFQVTEQRIKNLDSVVHIYGGTNNYLNLQFNFDSNWKDCVKVASFADGTVACRVIDDCCLVPEKAFSKGKLSFYILGGRNDGYRIKTETFTIVLGG